MPLLVTMSLFGSIGTAVYILLRPLFKKYFSLRWRRIYLMCNILEYLIPFPYYHIKYKKLLNTIFARYLPEKSVEASRYVDDTTDFIQITAGKIEISNAAIYILITGIVITGILLFGYQIYKYWRIRHFLQDDTKDIINKQYNRVVQECISNHNMTNVRVYKCDHVDTPFTIGIIRPIIVLPDIGWKEKELAFVIEHELAHIRHHDNLVKMVSLAMLTLNFCNPLAYLVLHEWNLLAELSCDSEVISGLTDDEVIQYGRLIIRMAEKDAKEEDVPATGFNLQEMVMRERIFQMKKRTKKSSLAKKLLGTGVMGVLLFSTSFTVFAYNPKNTWVVDDIGDTIIFCEDGVAPWGNVHEDLPICDSNEWIFVSDDGEIVDVIDEDDIGIESHSACNHNYVSGELAKHTRFSNGNCKIEYYAAQKCSECGNYIIGDLKSTVTYSPCPH